MKGSADHFTKVEQALDAYLLKHGLPRAVGWIGPGDLKVRSQRLVLSTPVSPAGVACARSRAADSGATVIGLLGRTVGKVFAFVQAPEASRQRPRRLSSVKVLVWATDLAPRATRHKTVWWNVHLLTASIADVALL